MIDVVPSFILRLMGKAPEQKEAERQFRRSLEQHEQSEKDLDDILGRLHSLNIWAKKSVEHNRSLVPPRSDHTPIPGSVTGG
jgi:hypothetical protein